MADKIDISAVARVVDQASGPLKAIQGSISNVQRAAAATGRTFTNLGGARLFASFRNLGTSFANLGRSIRSVITPMTALLGIAGIAGAVAGMKSYIDTASQLYWTSKRLGLSAEDLQKYRYAAQQMGLSAEGLDKNLGMLQRTLGKVAQGGKANEKTIALLAKMGVTMAEIKAGDISAILPKIAKGFEANVNPVQRNAAAMALFGRAGKDMINFLSSGPKTIAEFTKEAERLGIITNKQAEEARIASDAMLAFNKSIEGIKNAIIGPLIPEFTKLVDQTRMWITANKPEIVEAVSSALRSMRDILLSIDWKAVGEGFRGIGRAIKYVVDLVGGWENAIIGLIAVMNPLTPALLAIAAAFIKVGIAMLTTPVGWIIAAVAAIAAGVYLLYKNWHPIVKWFKDTIWKPVVETFEWAWEKIEPIVNFIKDAVGVIKGAASAVGEFVGDAAGAIGGAAGWVGETAGAAAGAVGGAASWVGEKAGALGGAMVNAVKNVVAPAATDAAVEVAKGSASGNLQALAKAPGGAANIQASLVKDLQKDLGLERHQAAGLVGNLAYETGQFKHLQEIKPYVPGSRGGYGIAQWTGPRRRDFENYVKQTGVDPTTYEANLGFLKHELQGKQAGYLKNLRNAQNIQQASRLTHKDFLAPLDTNPRLAGGGTWKSAGQRLRYGQQAEQASLVQANAAAEQSKISGAINSKVTVEASPELVAKLAKNETSGAVRKSDVEVGRSMQPAMGMA